MDELISKKILVVNLSSIHELKYQTSVLNAIAALEDSYPSNLPGHIADFASGKYNQLINDYKTGKMDTDQFLTQLATTANLNFSGNPTDENKKKLLANAWNTLIDLESNDSCCYFPFFCCPTFSCEQKFQKIIDYAKNNNIDEIYFMSNTNPLNVEKILVYLNEKFQNLININDAPDQNGNIRISIENAKFNISLALSYTYKTFKTVQDNTRNDMPLSTPDLLKNLQAQFNKNGVDNKNIFIISQYSKDLEEAGKLGMMCCEADKFYNNTDIPNPRIKDNEIQPLLIS